MRNLIDAICFPFRILSRIPSNLISSPTRLLGLSLPMRVAVLLGLGLAAILIGWTIMISTLDGKQQLLPFLREELPILIVLVLIIPIVVWYALKLWLDGPSSPFPEIDRDWETAVEAMAEQKIDPAQTPLFLVLGLSDPESVQSMMGAAKVPSNAYAPRGVGELQVWANQDAIYVHLIQTCCLSTLLGEGFDSPDGARETHIGYGSPTAQVGGFGMTGSLEFFNPPLAPELAVENQVTYDRTQVMPVLPIPDGTTQIGASGLSQPPDPSLAPRTAATAGHLQGTMQVGEAYSTPKPVAVSSDRPLSRRLSHTQAEVSKAKLIYVCDRLRRMREPLVAINGVIAITPFDILANGSDHSVDQIRTALATDIATLRQATRVRCGVTHIVGGMQKDPGFRELIRRFSPERASVRRVGKGFPLAGVPTILELERAATLACGTIEDWVYSFFHSEQHLGSRNNRKLYGLLGQIRGPFQNRLASVMESAYAVDPRSVDLIKREPLFFSGCYFVAAGPSSGEQAFAAGVFDKPIAEQGELEWGSEAVAQEARFQTCVQVFLILNGILIASIIAMFIYMYS